MNIQNNKNINLFNPNFIIQDWCFDKLLAPEEVEYYQFYNKEKGFKRTIVPINQVVGTCHYSYIGNRWIDLVRNMKRFRDFYTSKNFIEFLETNPNHTNGWSYIKYGENYFVLGGNHRNCQAKFSNVEYIVTDVNEFILDEEMLSIFKKLIDLKLEPKIEENHYVKYNRASTWNILMNNTKYIFYKFSAIQKFISLYINTSITFIDKLKLKYFNPKRAEKYYKESDNYNQLIPFIKIHKMVNYNTLR